MIPRPIHRWNSFWLGLLALSFLGWAWTRPVIHGSLLLVSTVGAQPYQMRHLGGLMALDRVSGRPIWRHAMPHLPGGWGYGFIAPAAVSGGRIVIGGLDGSLYAFPIGVAVP